MRRIIAILLMSFLSFQSVWAAVGSYEPHEQHVGHHLHAEHGTVDADAGVSGSDGAASSSNDLDCGHCHCSCASILQRTPSTSADVPNLHPRPALEASSGAHASARPERPQWLCLA